MASEYFVRSGGRERGPFTSEQLRGLVARGDVSQTDQISMDRKAWHPAAKLTGVVWPMPNTPPAAPRPSAVDAIAARLIGDDQDPAVVRSMLSRVLAVCTATEEVRYIAVQKKPVITLAPDCVVATTRRIIFYRAGILGRVDMIDFIWRELYDARIAEGMLSATFTVRRMNGQVHSIEHIPKKQARAIYRICQEMEEQVLDERRTREMEESRARAGGIHLNLGGPTSPQVAGLPVAHAAPDPRAALQQIKDLHEDGLLSDAEYEAKRKEIIAKL